VALACLCLPLIADQSIGPDGNDAFIMDTLSWISGSDQKWTAPGTDIINRALLFYSLLISSLRASLRLSSVFGSHFFLPFQEISLATARIEPQLI